MVAMTVKLRSVAGTSASLGWSGAHALVVDRPEGKAGGQGLGFNGGQLLGLAIGGCLCNDLHYVAHGMGIRLAALDVDVTLSLEGEPLRATSAAVVVAVEAEDPGADVDALLRRAVESSTVSNSIAQGVAVEVTRAGPGPASRP